MPRDFRRTGLAKRSTRDEQPAHRCNRAALRGRTHQL